MTFLIIYIALSFLASIGGYIGSYKSLACAIFLFFAWPIMVTLGVIEIIDDAIKNKKMNVKNKLTK